jgi:2-polyprenyl-3-methyl-5-hydroxy-6-metoxy-1,4-benzoquinol methylase
MKQRAHSPALAGQVPSTPEPFTVTWMTQLPWQLEVFHISVRKREKWSWIRSTLVAQGLPRGRCVDVGCGVGTLSILLKNLGGSWMFLEPDVSAAAEAEALLGVPVLRTFLRERRLPDASVDLITAFDVLEHLADQKSFLEDVARVLAPGGFFVATTPAAHEGRYVWRTIGERFFGITKEAHGHVVEGFSKYELDTMLGTAGLQTVGLTAFSKFFTEGLELGYNGAYHLLNARRQQTRGYNLALSPESGKDVRRYAWLLPFLRIVSPVVRGISFLDRLLPIGPGYEYGIVARKPLSESRG